MLENTDLTPTTRTFPLVDTHCHLNHVLYNKDLPDLIQSSRSAGVKAIICSGVNPPTNLEVLDLTKAYPDILKCTFGIYPIDAIGLSPDEAGLSCQKGPIDLDEQFAFFNKHKDDCVGIGEVGMDFHWDKDHHELQKQNFERIIEFVESFNKPIVIHSRDAEKECVDLLISSKIKKVVLHCFAGNKSLIKKASDAGFYFSIPAISKRLQHFQILSGLVPLSHLLTETDGPWLPPVPQTRNEPKNVIESIKVIAQVKNLTVEDTALNIFKNYQDVFL